MISYLIGLAGSILGIVGFFKYEPTLIIIGGCLCLFETLLGLLSGQLRTIGAEVCAVIVGLILAKTLELTKFVSVMFSVCVITCVLSIISLLPLLFIRNFSDD